jgi:hypothetical protein
MRYELTKQPETGIHVVNIGGNVLPGDLIEMLKVLWQDDTYIGLAHAIWDFTESDTNYYFEDIFKLFEFVKEAKQLRGPHTLAVVAPHDNEFGMSRMYAMLSEVEGPKVNVFREIAPATSWLQEQMLVQTQ